jgi:D-3-phosphoglycerate dehydrogenase
MKVLVADRLAVEALDKLKAAHDVHYEELSPEGLLEQIPAYHGLIVRSRTRVTAEAVARGSNLKVIGRAGVGVDNIDVAEATRRGIPVVNAPTGSTVAVAELTMAHMLSLARHLPRADSSLRAGRWEKKQLQGVELAGKTLGFVGFGRIGKEVARRAASFGMVSLTYDPYMPDEKVMEEAAQPMTLDEILERSDFVTIHALLTDETRGMIGEEQLRKMKPTAYIVNCARGGIVDEAALARALKEGWIAGAALDVYEREPPEWSPLLSLENTSFTPHLGASTKESQIRTGLITVEQVLKVLAGEWPDFCVNQDVLRS